MSAPSAIMALAIARAKHLGDEMLEVVKFGDDLRAKIKVNEDELSELARESSVIAAWIESNRLFDAWPNTNPNMLNTGQFGSSRKDPTT